MLIHLRHYWIERDSLYILHFLENWLMMWKKGRPVFSIFQMMSDFVDCTFILLFVCVEFWNFIPYLLICVFVFMCLLWIPYYFLFSIFRSLQTIYALLECWALCHDIIYFILGNSLHKGQDECLINTVQVQFRFTNMF